MPVNSVKTDYQKWSEFKKDYNRVDGEKRDFKNIGVKKLPVIGRKHVIVFKNGNGLENLIRALIWRVERHLGIISTDATKVYAQAAKTKPVDNAKELKKEELTELDNKVAAQKEVLQKAKDDRAVEEEKCRELKVQADALRAQIEALTSQLQEENRVLGEAQEKRRKVVDNLRTLESKEDFAQVEIPEPEKQEGLFGWATSWFM